MAHPPRPKAPLHRAPAAPRSALAADGSLSSSSSSPVAHAQLLTKAGALNVPEWYEAGKVYEAGKGAIPLGSLLMVQVGSL